MTSTSFVLCTFRQLCTAFTTVLGREQAVGAEDHHYTLFCRNGQILTQMQSLTNCPRSVSTGVKRSLSDATRLRRGAFPRQNPPQVRILALGGP